jgi:hypothetical protein
MWKNQTTDKVGTEYFNGLLATVKTKSTRKEE